MTEVPAGLAELAEHAVSLLGASAVAVRRFDSAGSVETLVLAGPDAAALRDSDQDPPPTRTRARWRRREPGGSADRENHPVTGPAGQQLGWLVLSPAPAGPAGRLLPVLLAHVGALLDNAALTGRLSAADSLLAERSDELRAANRAFLIAFEESVVGMAMISLDPADPGRYLRVNDALCRLTGYSREELAAQPADQLTHPDDRGLTGSAMRRAMAGRRTPFRTDKRYLRPDGSAYWVRVTVSPLVDDDDRPLYALSQVEDLSARGDHNAELAVRLDPLTGLLNHAALEQALDETVQRAHRHGTGCAVLLAELDGWDELAGEPDNAELAEQLQLALAQRLRGTLRGGDVISRVSENQFVIITEEVRPEQAAAVARRLADALAEPAVIGGRELSLAASMGVSVLAGAPGDDEGASLLAQARTALTSAREAGGGSHVLYQNDGSGDAGSYSRTLYVHPEWQGRPG